ncbi:DUF3124 domain-containing protein [Bradyrhizobium sp. sGM-13]|uniref:DUF3124 domain-containing protein n=1 Tax=Bradyrhizobium sp. sGM-13 TaxID=2831781 RepID=UPI002810DF61|nr:DUF3124 domain-containing protein [Bradyrhizobium sp. sGM-13]
MGAFLAILAVLSIPYALTASARTAGGIEQNFATSRPLIPERIAYFDTSGKMAGSYLKSPIALKPLATVEVFIAANDVSGETRANSVVDWAATGEIAEPTVEALMVGGLGAVHHAFIRQADQDRRQEG